MGSYYLIYTEKWFTEISSRLEESPKLTSVKITANTAPLSISAISNSFLLTDPDSADSCTLCPDLPSPISRDSPLCATEREELTPSRRSPRSPPSRNEYEIIA